MPSPIIHKRSAPAPKQVKLPARRHNTRASSSRSAPPKLVKRQSTLTQLDFVSSTPYSTREVISNTSEEDEEYFEPRPKRRKKLGQSTLTQKWGGTGDHWEADDDVIMVEEDEEEEEESPKKTAQDTQFAGTYLYGRIQDVSSELQSPSMVPSSTAASGDLSTRPTTADSKANPKTPRKQLRTEVPSSQTPSSALLSGKSRGEEISPLKGRSCTPIPMKMLRNASPSKSILKNMNSNLQKLGNRDVNAVPWKADIVSSPRWKEVPETPKRKLVRATTIQDSQDVDEWPVTVDIADAQKDTPGPRSSLKRTATVLDSQSESDLDDHTEDITVIHISPEPRKPAQKSQVRFSEYCQTVPDYHDHDEDDEEEADDEDEEEEEEEKEEEKEEEEEEEEEEEAYNYTQSLQQQTFDPVSAALDRDAARFGRETQSQFPLPHDAESDYDTAEEGHNPAMEIQRVEDSEPEYVAESPVPDPETQFVADSPVRVQASAELTQSHTEQRNGEDEQSLPPIIPDLSMPQCVAEESLPLPRPSQVSTVVSTQQSASRPNSADGGKGKGSWENSSPFPLPPESWREEGRRRRWETQSSDVYDFSLPMPPPLPSSSVRGTEGGV